MKWPARTRAAASPAEEAARPRLLIADDQPAILDALEILLRPEGYRVDRALSPREVIECLASETYDALILDRMLPGGIDGLAIIEALRRTGNTTPILSLSARSEVDERIQVGGAGVGAQDHLEVSALVRPGMGEAVRPFDPVVVNGGQDANRLGR